MNNYMYCPRDHVIQVKILTTGACVPRKATPFSAGYDICASENGSVPSRGRASVSTGIAFTVPHNSYGRISSRSGLSLREGIEVGGGVIDADYTGEVKVILYNHSDTLFSYSKGDRIAQLVVEVIKHPDVVIVTELDHTSRGDAGFGSTGIAHETLY
jgi:dUTP pyrophosphatase